MSDKKRQKKKYSLRMRMMEINVGIAIISFLLCGFLFIFSVSFLVRTYINNDINFFLTETAENLEKGLEYIENTVTGIRESDILMDYLKNGTDGNGAEQVHQTFQQTADINDSPNQGDEGVPVVDRIYLLRGETEYQQASYYALVSGEEEENIRIMKNVWSVYQEACSEGEGVNPYYYVKEKTLYVACPVLDDNMDEQGTLIFAIDLETIRQIMAQMGSYEDSFWVLYTRDGQVIDTYPEDSIPEGSEWKDRFQTEPYIARSGAEDYRIYGAKMSMGLRVSMGIPENHASRLLYDSVDIYVVGIVCILMAGIISFGIFTFLITKPIEEVKEKIREVRKGDFHAKLPEYDSQEFSEISRGFNRMTKEIDHLVNEVYEKQILVRDMELKFLQMQMNPHFMFNVLNALALQAKIDGNDELSSKISVFSQLIQAKIYRSESEKVQIRQEMEYVRYYLEIQKFRYGDQLTYSVHVEEGVEECYIPKLCIQLAAENAVVHGLEPKMGGGRVDIAAEQKDGKIQITVADNGVGFGTDGEIRLPLKMEAGDKSHNHVGINNADSIIKLMYGNEYGIHIYSKYGEGTRVIITIPLDRPDRGTDRTERADMRTGIEKV